MEINVKCFSKLSNNNNCRHDHANQIMLSGDRATVADLAERVQVAEEEIALVFLNGRRSGLENRLSDGDRVAFVPAVGGM